MNKDAQKIADVDYALQYQTRRLQELIQEMVQCCQSRTAYLSKKFDMPQAELRCLMLFEGERYLTAKGMAQKLEVAKSRVSIIVNGLMEKKLVEIIDDPRDARVKLITLTTKGLKKSEEIAAFTADLHERLLLELGVDERKVVISALDLLRTSMEVVKKQLV